MRVQRSTRLQFEAKLCGYNPRGSSYSRGKSYSRKYGIYILVMVNVVSVTKNLHTHTRSSLPYLCHQEVLSSWGMEVRSCHYLCPLYKQHRMECALGYKQTWWTSSAPPADINQQLWTTYYLYQLFICFPDLHHPTIIPSCTMWPHTLNNAYAV